MHRIMKYLLWGALLCMVLGAGAAYGVYWWMGRDLPDIKALSDYRPDTVSTVYAADGSVLGYFYREKRFLKTLDEMSPFVPKAFLAAEDSAFYHHEGVDFSSILRAAIKNIQAGGFVQGGSTITQQVIKTLLLTPERKLARKLKEVILAHRLEKNLSKDEILTIYLNQIYLGSQAYGVEAAARNYFGRPASELTLAQSAVLAGLPKAPSAYSPYAHPEKARQRQLYVLAEMRNLGWITPEEYDSAVAEPLEFVSMPDPSWKLGAYFLSEVRQWLIERFGEETVLTGGLRVYTTLDPSHQAAAEAALRKGLVESAKRRGWQGPLREATTLGEEDGVWADRVFEPGMWIKARVDKVEERRALLSFHGLNGVMDVKSMAWARTPDPKKAPEEVPAVNDVRKVLAPGDVVWASIVALPEAEERPYVLALEQEPMVEGALVSMDPASGDVKALVGGYDFFRSQFNRATQALRQPGSAFKPIVYSAALDNGFTAASVVLDAPVVFENTMKNTLWKPENFEGTFYGPTLLRTALAKSRNTVTIRVAQKVGVGKIIARAKALGLQGEFQPDLSISLGSHVVSLMNLCQAYSAFARGGSVVTPRMVVRVEDAWGKEIFTSEVQVEEAVTPENAFIITSLLQAVVQEGTGQRAKVLGRPVAGKTGTSNNEQDAWFMGYTPSLLTGVYVGFDQIEPMGKYETGSRAASPIWIAYRQAVEKDAPIEDFTAPPGIVLARVDAETGLLATPRSKTSYLLPFARGTQPTKFATGSDNPRRDPGNYLLRQID